MTSFLLLVTLVLPAGPQAKPVPDETYGAGGTRTTTAATLANGDIEDTIIIRDKNGTVREARTNVHGKNGDESAGTTYFDEAGAKTRDTMVMKDANGAQKYSRDERYTKGLLTSGEIDETVNGQRTHKRYDAKTERYEPIPAAESGSPGGHPKPEPDKWQGPELTSYFIAGITLINEDDGANRFNTLGLVVAYNHRVSGNLGVTADAGITFSQNDGTDYRRMQFLAGLSKLPDVDRRLFLSPHIMAGFTRLTNTFPLSDTSTSAQAFAMAVGTDLVIHLGDRATTQLRGDYNPSFFSRHVQHNFRGSVGLNIQF